MQRIILIVVACVLAWQPPPAFGGDGASASTSDLRLVAYGTLQKQKTGADTERFVLVDKQGQTTYQIAPAANVALDSHVGKHVEVVGTFQSGQPSDKRLLAEVVRPARTSPPAHFVEVQSLAAEETVPIPPPPKFVPGKPGSTTRQVQPLFPETVEGDGPQLIDPNGSPITDPYAGTSTGNAWHVSPCGPPERIWVRGEYLMWWTKGMNLPPLVTTGPFSVLPGDVGVLGNEGTQVLFPDGSLFDDDRQGGRVTIGGWLGKKRWLGWEVEYAALKDAATIYQAGSYDHEIVARPFNNQDPDPTVRGPDAKLVVYPNIIDGNVTVAASSQFQTLGAHLLGNIWCNHGSSGGGPDDFGSCRGFRLDLLGGYRYIGLDEGVVIHENSIVQVVPRAGLTLNDAFETGNKFQGGDIGLRGLYRRGRWWYEGLFRMAFGNTAEKVNIQGNTQLFVPPRIDDLPGVATPLIYPGGFLTQTTNIGQYERNMFAVSPELGVTAGFRVTPHLSATLGYTFLYLSRVVRPGNAIDLNVNPTYIPPPDPNNPPSGRPVPAFVWTDTDYWAQGLRLGVDYRW